MNLSTPPLEEGQGQGAGCTCCVMPVDTQRWPVHAEARLEAEYSTAQSQCHNPGLGMCVETRVQGSDFQGVGWVRDVCVYVGVLVVGVGCLGTSTGTTVDGGGVRCAALPAITMWVHVCSSQWRNWRDVIYLWGLLLPCALEAKIKIYFPPHH